MARILAAPHGTCEIPAAAFGDSRDTFAKVATFDFTRLTEALVPACRRAFTELRARNRDHHFYCMGLFTSGDFV